MVQGKDHDSSIPVGGLSFLVRIQFCQNTTWQGTVQWLDSKKTKPFRSLLELIMLINEAVAEGAIAKDNINPWSEKEEIS